MSRPSGVWDVLEPIATDAGIALPANRDFAVSDIIQDLEGRGRVKRFAYDPALTRPQRYEALVMAVQYLSRNAALIIDADDLLPDAADRQTGADPEHLFGFRDSRTPGQYQHAGPMISLNNPFNRHRNPRGTVTELMGQAIVGNLEQLLTREVIGYCWKRANNQELLTVRPTDLMMGLGLIGQPPPDAVTPQFPKGPGGALLWNVPSLSGSAPASSAHLRHDIEFNLYPSRTPADWVSLTSTHNCRKMEYKASRRVFVAGQSHTWGRGSETETPCCFHTIAAYYGAMRYHADHGSPLKANPFLILSDNVQRFYRNLDRVLYTTTPCPGRAERRTLRQVEKDMLTMARIGLDARWSLTHGQDLLPRLFYAETDALPLRPALSTR